eukprot:6172652-Pleurochrysis_carterae.AAC.1
MLWTLTGVALLGVTLRSQRATRFGTQRLRCTLPLLGGGDGGGGNGGGGGGGGGSADSADGGSGSGRRGGGAGNAAARGAGAPASTGAAAGVGGRAGRRAGERAAGGVSADSASDGIVNAGGVSHYHWGPPLPPLEEIDAATSERAARELMVGMLLRSRFSEVRARRWHGGGGGFEGALVGLLRILGSGSSSHSGFRLFWCLGILTLLGRYRASP